LVLESTLLFEALRTRDHVVSKTKAPTIVEAFSFH
jgi:hypothetical protein